MELLGILAIVVISISCLIGYYMRTKNHERMKLIEKGVNPDEGLNISEYREQTFLINGVHFLTLGFGLVVGHLIVSNHMTMSSLITYITSILIFGGIGFLINYKIIRNWNRHK
jgi:Domain of unknown function (DUF6249)